MNIQQLETFAAVYKHKNITKAAINLGITQPAASKRIASLEIELNCQLFYRIGTGLILTQAGRILQPSSEKILNMITTTKTEILNLGSSVSGTLEIACSHHIGLYRLPKILSQFNQSFPDVDLQLHFSKSEDAYRQVQQGLVDIALLTLPEKTDEQVVKELVWTDAMDIMIAKNHPLIKLGLQNKFEELLKLPAIFTEDTDFTRIMLEQKFSQYSLNKSKGYAANNLEIIRMLIESGLGWGVLPSSMRNTKLESIKVASMKFTRPLGFAYHNQRKPNLAAREFIKILTALL